MWDNVILPHSLLGIYNIKIDCDEPQSHGRYFQYPTDTAAGSAGIMADH